MHGRYLRLGEVMNSKVLADKFSINHKDLLRSIRVCIDNGEIMESDILDSTYVSSQNKTMPSVDISSDALIYLITSRRSLTRGEERSKQAIEVLTTLGCDAKIVIGNKDRFEDGFYNLLCSFCGDTKIIRQYPVNGNLIDFYIPEFGVFVEYDEEYHFTPRQKEKDQIRSIEIKEFLTEKMEGITPWIVRVRKGSEIQGLRAIIGVAALNSTALVTGFVNEETREITV